MDAQSAALSVAPSGACSGLSTQMVLVEEFMKILSAHWRALIGLGLAASIGCAAASPAIAGIQDSIFFTSPDGSSVAFDVHDVSRREVLNRLLTGKAIELEWVDAAFAEERISGTFKGSADSVLQRLLAQSDFVAVYDRSGDKSRIARLIIVGKASTQSKSPGPPKMHLATPPTAAQQAPVLRPVSGPADFTPPSPTELAITLIRPAPLGMAPPAVVPPSAADTALPLFVPPRAPSR
jgi:hypothetical protein